MADSDIFMLLCNDGRFIPIPAGVFLHGGPMSEPVDTAALLSALSVPRPSRGTTTLVADEQVLGQPEVVTTVQRALSHMPSAVRDRLVLRTVPDLPAVPAEPAGLDNWLRVADLVGLPRHGSFVPSVSLSSRLVAVDGRGR